MYEKAENKRNVAYNSTYIDQIKEIERLNWMESSRKAHFIRKNRNNVHAKACLKSELAISQALYEEVIGYLKDIIDTKLQNDRRNSS